MDGEEIDKSGRPIREIPTGNPRVQLLATPSFDKNPSAISAMAGRFRVKHKRKIDPTIFAPNIADHAC